IEQEIFAEGVHVYTSDSPGQPMPYSEGKHYRGMVHGDPGSVVSLSVFQNEITGLISTEEGNLVLGKVKGAQDNIHILYNDADLEGVPAWECGTPDDGIGYSKEMLTSHPGQRDPGDCIRVYVEVDDNIVTDMGGAANALNFTTSIFNQTITLFANEGITMSISEILVWTTTSPYNGTTGSQQLSAFQQNTGSINGDLGHLISFQPMGQGIAASFSGICNSNPDLSKCFSGIFPVYQVFPIWSWSVNVTTHEMGHLIGSRHTHACVWNFNNTAIDGCAGATEGNCPLPGNPPGGGTIMSYCHNAQGIGTNFSLGFGTQPGNVIRNTVKVLGNCLSSSCTPAPPEYCWSAGGHGQPSNEFWIQSVALESINNVSGDNLGYADFTGQSTTLSVDSTYTIAMTAANEGVNFTKAWGVYIDYNRDLDFYDAGEQVASGSGSLSVNFTFTVPASSPSVSTRMRVAMRRSDTGSTIPCGFNAYGEVEDYTVIIDASGGPTCSDGAQNGDETGVDCGGATCPVCPTCTDGIQNGDEEGVDCGGSCDACPGTYVFGHFFETGWDGWTDGGSDVARYSGSRSWEGNYSINLQDNSAAQSAMTSPAVNLTDYTSVQLAFYFYSNSMETGEDFFVQYYNGSTYTTVATFAVGYGGHFSNNLFWFASVTLTSAQVNFVSNARFRIQCDGSDNNDDIYIDAVTLTAFGGNPPCPDADLDGVCDSVDVCPGLDDTLIGTACDDGNECTENDVYLGAPYCACAGTPIPDCVPCNPQTASLTPNPLTHTGTGASSTNVLTLPSGSSDVEFTISNINAKLNGGNNGRFIDRVNVWYDSGSGAQLYGTFNGDQVSTVNVSITGTVQSVWVTLEDGYDGNSQVTQSISFTQVTHCSVEALMQENDENAFIGTEKLMAEATRSSDPIQAYLRPAYRHGERDKGLKSIEGGMMTVYPNPAEDLLQIHYEGQIDEIRLISAQGLQMHAFETDADLREISLEQIPAGLYVLMMRSGETWVTKKFIKL
ncbi:MAG TPA: M12 family metallo-peptidase, partial [Saprospiraceae bacterium]|nr:M12 family metallo-peptidase [Saprospiraceae bacterium]